MYGSRRDAFHMSDLQANDSLVTSTGSKHLTALCIWVYHSLPSKHSTVFDKVIFFEYKKGHHGRPFLPFPFLSSLKILVDNYLLGESNHLSFFLLVEPVTTMGRALSRLAPCKLSVSPKPPRMVSSGIEISDSRVAKTTGMFKLVPRVDTLDQVRIQGTLVAASWLSSQHARTATRT